MSLANATLFDRPVFEVARLLGVLFDQSAAFVMGEGSSRGSRERIALTSMLHHLIEEPQGEARSPIGFVINQKAAIAEFGARNDRGWISQGAGRIEGQLVNEEVARAMSEISAWIAEGLRLAGVIRRFMHEAKLERDMPNNWRKSRIWEAVRALGRSSAPLRKAEDIPPEDLLQIEAFEAEQKAEEEARAAAKKARAARVAATIEADKARIAEITGASEARRAQISVTLSKSQGVLRAVTRDATLAKELCPLSVKVDGAKPSATEGLVSCEPAKVGKGLLLSIFARTTEKKLTSEKVCKALHAIIKKAGYVTNPRFATYPYGDGAHQNGGGVWRLDAIMRPADAAALPAGA